MLGARSEIPFESCKKKPEYNIITGETNVNKAYTKHYTVLTNDDCAVLSHLYDMYFFFKLSIFTVCMNLS